MEIQGHTYLSAIESKLSQRMFTRILERDKMTYKLKCEILLSASKFGAIEILHFLCKLLGDASKWFESQLGRCCDR